MIKLENHLGTIDLTEEFFSSLIGSAASSCFGVAGMANSNRKQKLRSILSKKKSYADQGVTVLKGPDGLTIELHIIVTFGLNISEIVRSITNKVKYTVEYATGLEVKKINVFVDGMKAVAD